MDFSEKSYSVFRLVFSILLPNILLRTYGTLWSVVLFFTDIVSLRDKENKGHESKVMSQFF